jgi:thiol-disulfide isomerase/thioredoxin
VNRRTLLALAAPAVLVVAGCARRAGSSSTAAATSGQGSDARLGTVETFMGAQRKPAPPVGGELLDGSRFDIAGWRGKVVVVNVWGSWCAPCRAEAPDLQAAFTTTRELGVEFLGVDVRDGRDAARAFQDAFAITYPSLYDPAGQVVLGFSEVSPNVVPVTILLDRDLKIAAIFRKRVTERELEAAVRALATETAS